tara:strand:- start:144 stop:554 length:411 start_codon:yes stop_codon:yes gene_type:complete
MYNSRYRLNDINWVSHFGFVPFLRNHISIIPHVKVDTHEHSYAYSKDGIDVTWHSPEFINNEPTRLSDTMGSIFQQFQQNKENISIEFLAKRLGEMPVMKNIERKSNNPWDTINEHGKLLLQNYDIKQLIFLKRRE